MGVAVRAPTISQLIRFLQLVGQKKVFGDAGVGPGSLFVVRIFTVFLRIL